MAHCYMKKFPSQNPFYSLVPNSKLSGEEQQNSSLVSHLPREGVLSELVMV